MSDYKYDSDLNREENELVEEALTRHSVELTPMWIYPVVGMLIVFIILIIGNVMDLAISMK